MCCGSLGRAVSLYRSAHERRQSGRRRTMAAVEDQAVTTGSATDESRLQDLAKRHLWMHFTQMAGYEDHEIPIITKGDGCYVWDEHGNRYLDGLAALFCVNIGHGR